MDFDFINHLGWRDVVLVVAGILGIYLAFTVLRLFRYSGGKRKADPEAVAESVEPHISDAPQAPSTVPEFARELARTSVEGELQTLRRESADLRQEVANLAEEVARLRAARNVSPLYNEAMSLAQRGMPAEGIAGHCGISLGEAQLVAALSRSESEFERAEQGEDFNEPNPDARIRRSG